MEKLICLIRNFSEGKNPFIVTLIVTFFNGTLWYLYAALWTYVVFGGYFLIKKKIKWDISIYGQIFFISVLLGTEVIGRLLC